MLFRSRLAVKNFDGQEIVEKLLETDNHRRSTQSELDNLLAAQNNIAKQVGDLFKAGKKSEADDLKNKSAALKEESKLLADRLTVLETEMTEALVRIPNLPSTQVPPGRTPEDNQNIFQSAENFPELSEAALPHWELAAKYNLIDFELGVKLTGAGFPVYKGKGAKLQQIGRAHV